MLEEDRVFGCPEEEADEVDSPCGGQSGEVNNSKVFIVKNDLIHLLRT